VKGRDEEEIWSKAKWESEWEASLSQDVARRMRQGTLTEKNVNRSMHEASSPRSASCVSNPFDPLHLPSLFMFSVSLLGPLQSRVWGTIIAFAGEVKLALVGGFCVGLGIGLFLR
jgi:hypothetical protein